MNVIGSIPVPFKADMGSLSCLIHCADGIQWVDRNTSELCFMRGEDEISRVRLTRPYDRFTYCPQTNRYFAICEKNLYCIFVLDERFREIDCLKLPFGQNGSFLRDIWFDSQSQLIWLVTDSRICILNCNGDLLDTFMTAPLGTEYKTVCTHGKLIFAGFVRKGCLHLASYTDRGVYLEQICLGGGYAVRNIHPVVNQDTVYLHILVTKGRNFPTVLEIELSDCRNDLTGFRYEQLGNICVEYDGESSGFNFTCNIERRTSEQV